MHVVAGGGVASAISNRELSSSRLSSGGEPLGASLSLALSTLDKNDFLRVSRFNGTWNGGMEQWNGGME